MLAKENRIRKKNDFEEIFKQGRGVKRDFLYFKIKKNKLDLSRFGFIVGKNFSKKAVERNKIKRMLREVIRKKLPKIKKGFDVIIIVLPNGESNLEKIENIIEEVFKKSELFI